MIQVAHAVKLLEPHVQSLGKNRGALQRRLAGRRVDNFDLLTLKLRDHRLNFPDSLGIQRDVEAAGDTTLFVVVGPAGTNENDP